MKKVKLFIFCILYLVIKTNAQFLDLSDDYIYWDEGGLKSTKFSEYGRDFTPRGEMKMLFIFVNFDNPNDPNPNDPNWPANQDMPTWILNDEYMFNNISDFNNIPPNNRSISRYYYEMSKHLPEDERFKVYADYLTVEIELDPNTDNDWSDLSNKALDELEDKYANIETILQEFDNRRNRSSDQYEYDNSLFYDPDSVVDYAILVFRFNSNWDSTDVPIANMENWPHSSGAWSGINDKDFGSIEIKHGYTQPPGMYAEYKAFLHELSHCIFDAPHYASANGVFGKYFFTNTFWGMIPTKGNEIYACANAWERWYLGYIGIKHDLSSSSPNGNYVLRDYMTTGDAIRIEIPYVNNEYIWLENHQGINIFDHRLDFRETICCGDLPDPPTGLMIYLEKISDSKDDVSRFDEGANGIRLFNADGNYDFSIVKFEQRCEWCSNLIPQCEKGLPNAYNGYNLASRVRSDKNGNDTINWWLSYNSGLGEQDYIIWLGNNFVYGNHGFNSAFNVDQKIGISSNPAITNFQEYHNADTMKKLAPIYLNGISIKVISENQDGDITVQIKFDDYNFENDVRMCGNIILPPEHINILSNKSIDIDKSGTPNRNTLRNGKFVNPTIVTTSENSYLELYEGSSIILSDESALVLEHNSTLEIADNAKIIVKNGCTLHIKSGADLIIEGSGKIEINSGGYICIENGAEITLQDELSVINLYNGYNTGVNTEVLSDPGNCVSNIPNYSYTGDGSINTFNADVYIQNKTYTIDEYVAGKNIFAGSNVDPLHDPGPVKIKNGVEVVYKASQDIILEGDFEVEAGGDFEIEEY